MKFTPKELSYHIYRIDEMERIPFKYQQYYKRNKNTPVWKYLGEVDQFRFGDLVLYKGIGIRPGGLGLYFLTILHNNGLKKHKLKALY